jgi:hypothetical protein
MNLTSRTFRQRLAATTLALLGSATFSAGAGTIDFAALPADLFHAVNPVVGGLLFSNPQQYVMSAGYGPPAEGHNLLSGILSNSPNDGRFLTIRSADGQAFSLTSFVAAENTCCSEDHVLVTTGHFVDGTDRTLVFSNLSKSAWQTETLNWTGLSSVEMRSAMALGGYADFLSFNTTPVPEPASAVMLLAGIGLLVSTRKQWRAVGR